ncbi:MAG: hypothetical protein AB1349_08205 [Elusimicrobiota bacterium]
MNLFIDIEKGTPIKCDLCDGQPECERFCPYGAIELITDDKIANKKRKQVVSKLQNVQIQRLYR